MQVFISEAHGSPMNSGRPTASDLLAAIRGNTNTNNAHPQKRSRVQKLQPVLVSSREPPQESHRGDDVLQLTKTKSKNKTVVFSEEKKYSDDTKEGTEIPLIPLVSPPKAVKGILVRRKKESSISFTVTQNSPERSMSPNERQDDDSMSQDKTPVNQHNQDSQSKHTGKMNFSPATNAPSKLSEFFKRNQTISERSSKLPAGFTQATKINSVRLHSLTTDSSPQTNSNMLKKENSDVNQELSFPSLAAFVPNLKDQRSRGFYWGISGGDTPLK